MQGARDQGAGRQESEMLNEMTLAELLEELEALGPEPKNPVARGEWRLDVEAVKAEIASR